MSKISNSFRTIPIPEGVPVGAIIGKGGNVVKSLSREFHCRIRVDSATRTVSVDSGSGRKGDVRAVEDQLCSMFAHFNVDGRCTYSHASMNVMFVDHRQLGHSKWVFRELAEPEEPTMLYASTTSSTSSRYRYYLTTVSPVKEKDKWDVEEYDGINVPDNAWIRIDDDVVVHEAFDRITRVSLSNTTTTGKSKWKAGLGRMTFDLKTVRPEPHQYTWSQLCCMSVGTHFRLRWQGVFDKDTVPAFGALYERLLPDIAVGKWRPILKVHVSDTLSNASYTLKYTRAEDSDEILLKRAYGHRQLTAQVSHLMDQDGAGFRLRLMSRSGSEEARRIAKDHLTITSLDTMPKWKTTSPDSVSRHLSFNGVESYEKQHVGYGGLRFTIVRYACGAMRVECRVDKTTTLPMMAQGLELRDKLQLLLRSKSKNAKTSEDQSSRCIICLDQPPDDTSNKIICSNRHVVCMDCFLPYLDAEFAKDVGSFLQCKAGLVKCPEMGCEFTYTNLQIASTGNAMTEKWNRLHRKLGERDALRQLQQVKQNDQLRHRLEQALNLNCPHCNAVFAEYDGCDAVRCQCCSKYFCGLCLKPCETSQEAHLHAMSCTRKPTTSTYYSQADVRTKAHRGLIQNRICRIMGELSREERQRALKDFHSLIKDYIKD